MNGMLSPDIPSELSRLSGNAIPAGATISGGGIALTRATRAFGEASAALEGERSRAVQAGHAEAMNYVTGHLGQITATCEELLHIYQILMPGSEPDRAALEAALKRVPDETAHPLQRFERSIALLAHLSLAPIPGAYALARVACNIPICESPYFHAPLLFTGVEHHFPGLDAFADRGDPHRLIDAYRIAYGASCQQFAGFL